MNKHILDRYKEISLSNYDIFDLLNKKIRILTYPELIKYKNINDVLYPNGCFILLYMAKPNYGHWCCVIKHHDNIEFFNPYGDGLPDDELSNIPAHFRKISNQSYPHLTWLLYNSGQHDDIHGASQGCLGTASWRGIRPRESGESRGGTQDQSAKGVSFREGAGGGTKNFGRRQAKS